MESITPFIWLALGVFILAWFAQLVFPVEVYEKARYSNLSTPNKGRFAYTVESLFQIKTKWFSADKKYWWHITWFNTTVSLCVSAVVIFWTVVVIAIVAIVLGFIILAIIAGGSK